MKTTRLPPQIDVFGQKFDVIEEYGKIVVSHPRWSLSGVGDTLVEALEDLYKDFDKTCEWYSYYDRDMMTREAIDMTDYLISLVPIKVYFTRTCDNNPKEEVRP